MADDSAYHPHMDRTLDSTVLHVVRTRLVKEYPAQIGICLEALTGEQLWWRPNASSNSVANLVIHLAGSNRYYLEHVIGGAPDTRHRDAEFAARGGQDKAALQGLWAESVASTGRALEGLDPARLMDQTDRSGKMTTLAQILLHVSHHNSVHLGQIVYVAKQFNPGAIDDIWRTLRTG
jgi:uncharacterized damage-inducible protein DinB